MTTKRVYARIRARSRAKILIEGKEVSRGTLGDISTGGMSLVVREDGALPDSFQVLFTLPRSFRGVNAIVIVKSRVRVPSGVRLGCKFTNIHARDRERIERLITRSLDISGSSTVLNTATFFLCIDATWRIFVYLVCAYYGTVRALNVPSGPQPPIWYGITLACYFVTAFAAFLMTDRFSKRAFIISMACVTAALAFLVVKVIGYSFNTFLREVYPVFFRRFFMMEILLTAYAALAVFINIISYRKRFFLIGSLEEYR